MLNKIRYAYHLTACEKIIKKNKYYELDRKFIRHKRKLNKLITHNKHKVRGL